MRCLKGFLGILRFKTLNKTNPSKLLVLLCLHGVQMARNGPARIVFVDATDVPAVLLDCEGPFA